MHFDLPAELGKPHDLRVGQRRVLGDNRLVDDLAVAHPVDIGVDLTGDQRLSEAEDGFHGGDLPVRRHRVRGEQDASGVR